MRYILVSADNPNIQKLIDIPDKIIVSEAQSGSSKDLTDTPKINKITPKFKSKNPKKIAYKIIQTRTVQSSRPFGTGSKKSTPFRRRPSNTI